jgi:outer membrane lipoprotein-sorting protein
MKTLKTALAIALVTLCSSIALAQPDSETRRKLDEVAAKVAGIKNYKVDTKMETQMMGQTMTTTGEMTFQKPNKMRMTTTMDMMGGMTMKQEMVVSDDIAWTYMPMMNMATKMDMKKLKAMGEEQFGMAKDADITTPFAGFPEDKIKYIEEKETDDGAVYVFEAKPSFGAMQPEGSPVSQMLPETMIIWIDVDTGLPAKIIMKTKDDTTMMEQAYSNFRINVEIDESEFEFTLPEGVQVMDMTEGAMNMMQQMQGTHHK